MPAPGVAGKKTFYGKPAAFEGAMLLYGFHTISAARRCKPAPGAEEWRYRALVKADNGKE